MASDRADLNLTYTAAITAVMAPRPHTLVINGAAYAAVDKAEDDLVTAWSVNALPLSSLRKDSRPQPFR